MHLRAPLPALRLPRKADLLALRTRLHRTRRPAFDARLADRSALGLTSLSLGNALKAEVRPLRALRPSALDAHLLALRPEFLALLLPLGALHLSFGVGFLAAAAAFVPGALGERRGRRGGGQERDDECVFHGFESFPVEGFNLKSSQ
jgi:hypothetical protein